MNESKREDSTPPHLPKESLRAGLCALVQSTMLVADEITLLKIGWRLTVLLQVGLACPAHPDILQYFVLL